MPGLARYVEWMSRGRRTGRVVYVVDADRLFVSCARCSAWPMAANVAVPGHLENVRIPSTVHREAGVEASAVAEHH